MPDRPSPLYFKNLDALRFLSFISVFIAHVWMFVPKENSFLGFLFSALTFQSFLVPFFFTLSSFLISYKLLTEKNNNGEIALLKFYKRRALRIWPAYFLLIIACFIILPIASALFKQQQLTLPSVIPLLLFYVNFYIIQHGAAFNFALTILWSISIEEQFYLVWGAVLKFVRSNNLISVLFILFIFSVAFSYYYLLVQHKAENNLAIHSIFILQNFCTGALLAYIAVRQHWIFLFLATIKPVVYPLIYISLAIATYLVKDMVLLNVIKSVCYSLIIYDQVFNTRRIFTAGKFRLINYFGKISYGLYLYHALIFVLLQKKFHLFEYENSFSYLSNITDATAAFIITALAAHFSYKFMETKFLALKSG